MCRFKNNKGLLPGAIWITGITASGKTTIGQSLYKKLTQDGFENIKFLDGEVFRSKLHNKYGYSLEDRSIISEFLISDVSNHVNSNLLVIVAVLNHKLEWRQNARSHIRNFMEVYLRCPVDVCAKRDYKGHYRRAFAKEKGYEVFIGVTEPYELSDNPELILDTSKLTIDECTKKIYQKTLEMFQCRDIEEEYQPINTPVILE